MFATHRKLEPTANPDGSLTVHATVNCTLADLARATGLRVEDAAFALNECGLLGRRKLVDALPRDVERSGSTLHEDAAGEAEIDGRTTDTQEECIVISREMVEAVAHERIVKPMCMDLAHVLL